VDHERYLELSRAVSGEVMTEVFGEWRRAGSPCRGGIVLWAKDLCAGAGWGILDHRGEPKVAYHHLRRALAPVAVWSTDEGLGGVVAHIANDRSEPLRVRLRVALYRDFHQLTEESAELLELPPHGAASRNVEALLGHFVDVAWAYRFGPPAQDLIVMSLEAEDRDGYELVSQAFRFPAGRPLSVQPAGALGLTASLRGTPHGGPELVVKSAAFAHGVRATVPGHRAGDDAFSVEPGHERVLAFRPDSGAGDAEPPSTATLTALNLAGRLRVEAEDG
jgi:beta-mannosidase